MSVIRVFDAPGDGLYEKIFALSPADAWTSGYADAAVISPKAAVQADKFSGTCGVLLLPGRIRRCGINAECAVSYGLSQQDSITLSAMDGDKRVIALQREIMGADCRIIEPQEFTVTHGGDPEFTLALFGAALILGGLGI